MTSTRRQRASDVSRRLAEAESAATSVEDQGKKVNRQLSLVGRLTEGWRRVHEVNHLAQLFTDEGRLG
jgi:hypothetical protein